MAASDYHTTQKSKQIVYIFKYISIKLMYYKKKKKC